MAGGKAGASPFRLRPDHIMTGPWMFKNLREEIDSIIARDPAARSRTEVALAYPGFTRSCCIGLRMRCGGASSGSWPAFSPISGVG